MIQPDGLKIYNDEQFYQEWYLFSDVAERFFSLPRADFEQNPVQDESPMEAYYRASTRFLSALKLYQNTVGISFAVQQDVYRNDIFMGLFVALEDSLFIMEQEMGTEDGVTVEVAEKLFGKYLLIQKEMIGFFHLLNESARVSGSIITAMLCSLSFITFGGLVFVLNYIKRRTQIIQLAKKVEEQKLVVKIQEAERMGLGAELHDTIVQDVKALKLFIGQLESRIEKTEEIDDFLSKINQLTKRSLSLLYNILNSLVPPELSREDFKRVLLSLCGEFKKNSGIECVFYVEPGARLNALTGDIRLQLYRVIQEPSQMWLVTPRQLNVSFPYVKRMIELLCSLLTMELDWEKGNLHKNLILEALDCGVWNLELPLLVVISAYAGTKTAQKFAWKFP